MSVVVCNMATPVQTFVGMVTVILIQSGSYVLTKFAFSTGTNEYVFVVYNSALSACILLPCSLIFDRSRPPLSFSTFSKIFLLSLIEVHIKVTSSIGLRYSSPMLSTAMLNLIPAFTFILTIILRMEKVDWRNKGSLAKFGGTIVSIAGAFVVTFYKGIPILKAAQQLLLSPKSNWLLGSFFNAAHAFFISAWYILQTLIVLRFPAIFTILFFSNFFSTIMSSLYCIFLVHDAEAWKFRFDQGLIAVIYSVIIATVLHNSLLSWCLSKAGPLYASMFKPLAVIVTIILDYIFLNESLGVGSVIGAAVIVIGFYAVMWGKAKEESLCLEKKTDVENSGSSDKKVPLLQNKIEDI